MNNAEKIAALEAALASGVRRVRFEGQEIEYRSVDEMLRALETLRAAAQPRWRLTPMVMDRHR